MEKIEKIEKMKLGEKKLFNAETKERFLNENCKDVRTQGDYKGILYRVSYFEQFHDTDLYNFNYIQLKDTLSGLQCTTPKAVDHAKSVINTYFMWAKKEKYINKVVNIMKLIVREDVHENVSNHAINEQYIWSREELYKLTSFCVNDQDAVLFVLAYGSVRGKALEEIRNLKVTDLHPTKELLEDSEFIELKNKLVVGNSTITVTRTLDSKSPVTRSVSFEEESMKVILRAVIETEYFKKNGDVNSEATSPVLPVLETEYVVRYTGNRCNTKDNRLDTQSIIKRMGKIANLFQKSATTPTTIFYSGMLNWLKQQEELKGILDNTDFRNAQVRYGMNPERFWDIKDLYQFLHDRLK